MLPTVYEWNHGAFKQISDPVGLFVRNLNGFKKFPAKLLNIMLFECISLCPLKTFEQPFCTDRFLFSGLKEDKKFLKLKWNGVLILQSFRVVDIGINIFSELGSHKKSLYERIQVTSWSFVDHALVNARFVWIGCHEWYESFLDYLSKNIFPIKI